MLGFSVVSTLEKHAQPTKFSAERPKIGIFSEADENDKRSSFAISAQKAEQQSSEWTDIW